MCDFSCGVSVLVGLSGSIGSPSWSVTTARERGAVAVFGGCGVAGAAGSSAAKPTPDPIAIKPKTKAPFVKSVACLRSLTISNPFLEWLREHRADAASTPWARRTLPVLRRETPRDRSPGTQSTRVTARWRTRIAPKPKTARGFILTRAPPDHQDGFEPETTPARSLTTKQCEPPRNVGGGYLFLRTDDVPRLSRGTGLRSACPVAALGRTDGPATRRRLLSRFSRGRVTLLEQHFQPLDHRLWIGGRRRNPCRAQTL